MVTECETSSSGNKHILTIIDHLTGWPEAFPIPNKPADTIVSTFINQYLPVHMYPRYILSDNDMEFKNHFMDQVLQQLGIDCIFPTPYHPQSNRKLKVFHKYLKPTLKKLCKKDQSNWDKYINQVLTSYRVISNLATAETPFFLVYGRDPNLPLQQLGTSATIPRRSRIWLTQPGSTLSSPSHCQKNTGWKLLQDCPENHR